MSFVFQRTWSCNNGQPHQSKRLKSLKTLREKSIQSNFNSILWIWFQLSNSQTRLVPRWAFCPISFTILSRSWWALSKSLWLGWTYTYVDISTPMQSSLFSGKFKICQNLCFLLDTFTELEMPFWKGHLFFALIYTPLHCYCDL